MTNPNSIVENKAKLYPGMVNVNSSISDSNISEFCPKSSMFHPYASIICCRAVAEKSISYLHPETE